MSEGARRARIGPPERKADAVGVQLLSLVAVGLSVGWLAGLSVSPVAGSVIAGLLGLVGGLGAGAMLLGSRRLVDRVAGGGGDSPRELDLRPAAVLALSVAVAVPGGIMARTYQLFAPPAGRAAGPVGESAGATAAVLFSDHLDDCSELIALSRDADFERFRARVRESSGLGERLAVELAPETLRLTVRALCTSS